MQCPGDALIDIKVLEAVHLLHQEPVDIKAGLVHSLFLPEIHYQLLCVAGVRKWGVVLTLMDHVLYVLQVGISITIMDQAHHHCVVSKRAGGIGVESG